MEPPGRGMGFAERQLRRHGWRRGQGLGKREDGIAEAIRVKVKCDTAGVGHDMAEPFSFHWWDHVFNKAAANIAVEAGQDGVSMKTLSEDGLKISNKKPRKAGSADMLYGRFVKSATLTAHGEESTKPPPTSESSEEEEEEKLDLSSARRLTDEELMRVCGGRTAHKGARHGLTMSAKLARLEEQERAFLATYRHVERPPPESSPGLAEGQEKRKKKKKKRSRDGADPEVLQSQEPNEEEEVAGEEDKVMKRKENQEPSGEEEVAGEEQKVVKRKRKKKKNQENQEPSREEEVEGEEGKATKRKKKKKREEEEEEPVETEKEKKKRKKDKKKMENDTEEPAETEVPLEDTDGPDQAGHSPRKKRKKKKREPE